MRSGYGGVSFFGEQLPHTETSGASALGTVRSAAASRRVHPSFGRVWLVGRILSVAIATNSFAPRLSLPSRRQGRCHGEVPECASTKGNGGSARGLRLTKREFSQNAPSRAHRKDYLLRATSKSDCASFRFMSNIKSSFWFSSV